MQIDRHDCGVEIGPPPARYALIPRRVQITIKLHFLNLFFISVYLSSIFSCYFYKIVLNVRKNQFEKII